MPKSSIPDENGVTIKVCRIKLFYGLQGLTGYDLSNRCAELLKDRKFHFFYPRQENYFMTIHAVVQVPVKCKLANAYQLPSAQPSTHIVQIRVQL